MDPMEFPPGDTSLRPQAVLAGAARTQQVREEERALELYTLVAVQRDSRVPLTCEEVLRDTPQQLGVPEQEMAVEGMSKAVFLLRFGSLQIRNTAMATPYIQVGGCVLKWSRRIGASVGRFRYRSRVCLEGVPRHARNAAAVAQLFSAPSYINEVDCTVEKEEEKFCFTVWVWMAVPHDLVLQGTLQIQEPDDFPDEQLYGMDDMDLAIEREEPVKTFNYEILIHLDRVLDYDPDLDCPHRPATFRYDWFLGSSSVCS
ncbi:unnamed protein product [Urochloa humidicola]